MCSVSAEARYLCYFLEEAQHLALLNSVVRFGVRAPPGLMPVAVILIAKCIGAGGE